MPSRRPPTEDDVSMVHSALSHPQRRAILDVLEERSGPIAIKGLARELASRDHDEAGDEPDESTVETAVVMLYHKHLPVLKESGLVEFDRSAKTVSPLAPAPVEPLQ